MKRLGTLSLAFLAALVAAAVSMPATAFQSDEFADIVARARPAVVLVEIKLALGDRGFGTGFVYNSSGYILTNHHVIEGATDIRVILSDGRAFPATVVDYIRYKTSDLTQLIDAAVIKIAASGLATLPLQSAKPVRDGQRLLVLGYPGELPTDKMSTTSGLVSAVREGWIQTDATILPGNSGGPVLDTTGRVIGLTTFIIGRSRRFGGAMWINKAMDLTAQAVIPDGRRWRIINVPGIEYFKPRQPGSDRYSAYFEKSWRVSGDRADSETEATEVTADYGGASFYRVHATNPQGPLPKQYYLDSEGLFDVSNRADPGWYRVSRDPVMISELPLESGRAWESRETWRTENVSAYRPGDPLPVDMMEVSRRTTIESLEEDVTVPAGTYQNCVKITEYLRLPKDRDVQERRIITTWYAAMVGAVKIQEETSTATGTTRVTKDLESVRWTR